MTFNSNDGSEVASQSILDKEKIAQPEAPTREGYTFDGWFQDSALEQAFDFDTVIEADLTLHAKWSKIDVYHTVTFNSNDGNEIASQSILDKEKVAQPEAPIREGYTFDGWFQDSALEQAFDFDTIIESDLTLHAKWNKIDVYHTVTFNSNDGSEVASQSILDKEKIAQPEAPIREGYTFDGWFQDSALQQAFDFDTIIESDLTLHAKWNKIDVYHTVTFNSNDGNEIASQSILDKEKVAQPEAPIREGYTFDGWFQDSALQQAFDFDTIIESDLTLHAKWSKINSDTDESGNTNHDGETPKIDADEKKEVSEIAILPNTGFNQSTNLILAVLVIFSGLLTLFVSIKGKE